MTFQEMNEEMIRTLSEEDKSKLAEILSKSKAEIVFGLSELLQQHANSESKSVAVDIKLDTTEFQARAASASSSSLVYCQPCYPGANFNCWRRI